MGKKKNEDLVETQLVKNEPVKDEELKAANTEDIVKALDDEIGSAIGFLESQGYKVFSRAELDENQNAVFPKEVFEGHEEMRFWGMRMSEGMPMVSDLGEWKEKDIVIDARGFRDSMETLKEEAFKLFLDNVEKFENKEDFKELVVPCFRFEEIAKDEKETGFARSMAKRIHNKLMQSLKELGFPSMYKISVLEHRLEEKRKEEEREQNTEVEDDDENERASGDDGPEDEDAITSGYK